jgi:hypothetical protein
MTESVELELKAKYPSIFEDNTKKYGFIFECNNGWSEIIDRLCSLIVNHEENKQKYNEYLKRDGRPEIPYTPVKALQVKEKFGGLRFYVSGGDDYVRGLIDAIESQSYVTCEDCGNKGKRQNRGNWILTLCDQCFLIPKA